MVLNTGWLFSFFEMLQLWSWTKGQWIVKNWPLFRQEVEGGRSYRKVFPYRYLFSHYRTTLAITSLNDDDQLGIFSFVDIRGLIISGFCGAAKTDIIFLFNGTLYKSGILKRRKI